MSEAAVQVPATNAIVLFPQKIQEEKPQIEAPKPLSPDPGEIADPEPESQYAKDWSCVADGVYRYNPSGTSQVYTQAEESRHAGLVCARSPFPGGI